MKEKIPLLWAACNKEAYCEWILSYNKQGCNKLTPWDRQKLQIALNLIVIFTQYI